MLFRSYIDNIKRLTQYEPNVSNFHMEVDGILDFMHYVYGCKNKKNFYVMRKINKFSPHEGIGYIVLSASEEKFRNILDKNLDDSMFFFLLSEDGEIVSHCNTIGGDEQLDSVQNQIFGNNIVGKNGRRKVKLNGIDCLISYKTSDYSGLTLVTGKPVHEVYSGVYQSVFYVTVALIIMWLLSYTLNLRYTKKQLKRLEVLSHTMENYDLKKLNHRFSVTQYDEIGILCNPSIVCKILWNK